jgi:hypothetical protein
MKWQLRLGVAVLAIASFAAVRSVSAAPETLTGRIADSMCGAGKHQGDGTVAGDTKCTIDCVKDHGSQYVLVVDKKVYKIGNQKFADLQTHAGHAVDVTGELKGDTITITKIAMAKGK